MFAISRFHSSLPWPRPAVSTCDRQEPPKRRKRHGKDAAEPGRRGSVGGYANRRSLRTRKAPCRCEHDAFLRGRSRFRLSPRPIPDGELLCLLRVGRIRPCVRAGRRRLEPRIHLRRAARGERGQEPRRGTDDKPIPYKSFRHCRSHRYWLRSVIIISEFFLLTLQFVPAASAPAVIHLTWPSTKQTVPPWLPWRGCSKPP
jgi:hypothetical protein